MYHLYRFSKFTLDGKFEYKKIQFNNVKGKLSIKYEIPKY